MENMATATGIDMVSWPGGKPIGTLKFGGLPIAGVTLDESSQSALITVKNSGTRSAFGVRLLRPQEASGSSTPLDQAVGSLPSGLRPRGWTDPELVGLSLAGAVNQRLPTDIREALTRSLSRQSGSAIYAAITHDRSNCIAVLRDNLVLLAERDVKRGVMEVRGGFRAAARSAAFSPDEQRFVVNDGAEIQIRDRSGNKLFTLGSHQQPINSVDWSSCGRWIASGGEDGEVKIWSAERLSLVAVARGHQGPVHCIRFLPDSRTIASAGKDGRLLLCDVLSGEVKCRLLLHRGPINAIDITSDGRWLATGGEDGEIHLLATASASDVAACPAAEDDNYDR